MQLVRTAANRQLRAVAVLALGSIWDSPLLWLMQTTHRAKSRGGAQQWISADPCKGLVGPSCRVLIKAVAEATGV